MLAPRHATALGEDLTISPHDVRAIQLAKGAVRGGIATLLAEHGLTCFRWQYDAPNKQVIVANGKRVYLHDLDLNQVSHQSQAKALRGTPALLLAEDAPIDRDFNARSIDSSDGREWVELKPKATDTDIQKIELGFGDTGLESLIMEDSFGQTTRLNFSAIKRNPSLNANLFKVDEKATDDFLSFD